MTIVLFPDSGSYCFMDYDEEDLLPEDKDTGAAAQTALATLNLALDGELRPLHPAVFIPPGVRLNFSRNGTERQILAEQLAETFGKVTVEDNILRIEREVDPIGMAIAIAQGMSIPVYVPQANGDVKVSYVQVSTRERMKILNKLTDRVLPPSSPRKANQKDADEMSQSDPVGFLAAVERAAQLARTRMNGATIIEARDTTYDEEAMVEDDAKTTDPTGES